MLIDGLLGLACKTAHTALNFTILMPQIARLLHILVLSKEGGDLIVVIIRTCHLCRSVMLIGHSTIGDIRVLSELICGENIHNWLLLAALILIVNDLV